MGPDRERLDPVNLSRYVFLHTTLPKDGERCIKKKVVFTFFHFYVVETVDEGRS